MLIDIYCPREHVACVNQPVVQPDMPGLIWRMGKSRKKALDSLNIMTESKNIILKQEKNGATGS